MVENKPQRGNPEWGVAKPYWQVREIVKEKNFKTIKQYQDWVREERIQGRGEGFPLYPHMTYARKNEWISREHFLGKTDIIMTPQPVASEDIGTTKMSFKSIRFIIRQILGMKDKTTA
jgi:hypothetical protein